MGKNVFKGNESAKGKGFDNNPENINKSGANRKSIASVNKDLESQGYKAASKKDIIDCYLKLINIDVVALKGMVEEEDQPVMIRIVGRAILSGKGFDVVEKVLDRGIGKAEANLKVETKVTEDIDYSAMSDKDLKTVTDILDKYKNKANE